MYSVFVDEKGGFYPQWKKDTGRYLYPCSDEVKQWLRKLKQNNKKLFILTSSRVDFAEASMNFVLGLVRHFHKALGTLVAPLLNTIVSLRGHS